MPSQTEAGKAFEFALLDQSYKFLSTKQNVIVKEDQSLQVVKNCFNLFSNQKKEEYLKAAKSAIGHITEIEPRLSNPSSVADILTLQIVPDAEGVKGDVRDLLFIRYSQNWEIGISAKNNHKAVKHSRLSDKIDFGNEWLGIHCSDNYFNSVKPLFSELRIYKDNNELFRNIIDKEKRFYFPLLEAFKKELLNIDSTHPGIVPGKLMSYLIGNKDFYKVIKRNDKVEIYGFNLHGSLNKYANQQKPKFNVPRVKLPTRIIELTFKPQSYNTLILTCSEGWQVSFRIHNASSRVEPSLKFDINLIGQPQNLYAHHLKWL